MREEGKYIEYQMTVRGKDRDDSSKLAESLTQLDKVLEFRLTPAGD